MSQDCRNHFWNLSTLDTVQVNSQTQGDYLEQGLFLQHLVLLETEAKYLYEKQLELIVKYQKVKLYKEYW